MTLTIISHTEHYLTGDGTIVGLGSTVTEINHLLSVFDRITHIAMLHTSTAPPSALPYVSDRIEFVAIPAVGGASLVAKISILRNVPKTIHIIRKHLKHTDYFQFRAPTGIGVFVLPYLILFTTKKGWFKYAGNWKQDHAPLAYLFQKWLLEHQSRPVTINGFWNDQPAQCLSFENPCLTEGELQEGLLRRKDKQLHVPINLCFVGRLEPAKGLDLFIEAVGALAVSERKKIGVIHLVGDGERMPYYESKVSGLDLQFKFHGFLSRDAVRTIYTDAHAIILPSASEGFPKVIAEAMNYGCVPIVSNVSSIGHYILDGDNGFLLKELTSFELQQSMVRFLHLTEDDFAHMLASYSEFVKVFTYLHYNARLQNDIL